MSSSATACFSSTGAAGSIPGAGSAAAVGSPADTLVRSLGAGRLRAGRSGGLAVWMGDSDRLTASGTPDVAADSGATGAFSRLCAGRASASRGVVAIAGWGEGGEGWTSSALGDPTRPALAALDGTTGGPGATWAFASSCVESASTGRTVAATIGFCRGGACWTGSASGCTTWRIWGAGPDIGIFGCEGTVSRGMAAGLAVSGTVGLGAGATCGGGAWTAGLGACPAGVATLPS